MISEERMKDALAGKQPLVLFKVKNYREEAQDTRSHKTNYQISVLKTFPPEKIEPEIWHYGEPTLEKGTYLGFFKGASIVHDENEFVKIEPGQEDWVFSRQVDSISRILAQIPQLPDSILLDALKGANDIIIAHFWDGHEIKNDPSIKGPITIYSVKPSKALTGNHPISPTVWLKGSIPLKPGRMYIAGLTGLDRTGQQIDAREVFPGNMEEVARLHLERLETLKKKGKGQP